MKNIYALQEYYNRYLRDIRNLSENSINKYNGALNKISDLLVEEEIIKENIFQINTFQELIKVKEYIYNDVYFVEFNKKGHQIYSSSLNNYIKFAQGYEFSEIKERIELLDIELPVNKKISTTNSIVRSEIIKNQCLEYADYKCEIDVSHNTFISSRNNRPFMEGHHLLPINKQVNFNVSLDNYANVVCLCPICHRRIHHSLKEDRIEIFTQLYTGRKERLKMSGIRLSKYEAIEMII